VVGGGVVTHPVVGVGVVAEVGMLQPMPVQPSSQMHVPSLPLQRPLPAHVVEALHCFMHSLEYMFSSHTWQPMPEKPSRHLVTPAYVVQLAPVQPSSQMHVPSLPLQRPLPAHFVKALHCAVHPPE
jgi:hypothetical protein